MFMLTWNTKHRRVEDAIDRMRKSTKYTSTQLKALSVLQLGICGSGYVGIILALVTIAAQGHELSAGAFTVMLVVCGFSVFFFFQGLTDCEAAKLKAEDERKAELDSLQASIQTSIPPNPVRKRQRPRCPSVKNRA